MNYIELIQKERRLFTTSMTGRIFRVLGYSLQKSYSIAIGYQYRLKSCINNHRSIQQVSWKAYCINQV